MHKWLKRSLYLIAGIIVFFFLVLVTLQTNWAKNLIRNKLQNYLSHKTNTEFHIDKIDYSLPTWIELNGVFVRDLKKDTLLYGKTIKADVAMLKILSGEYQVDKILLEDIYINLDKKLNDTVYNYQFLMDAFKSKSESTTAEDTSLINFSLNELTLKNIRFNMLDESLGSFTKMSVSYFNLQLKNLDLNKMNFDVDKLYTDELNLQLLITKADTTTKLTTASIPYFLKFDSLIVKNSFVSYEDKINKIKSTNTIGSMQVAGMTNKDNPVIFKTKFIRLHNSDIAFDHVLIEKKETVNKTDTIVVANKYGFIIDEIDLNNNKLVYNNTAAPVKANGLDYSHIAFTGLNLHAINNSYSNGNIQSTIQGFSFKDKSGFQLDSLHGSIKMDTSQLKIDNFFVKTPGSTIEGNALIHPYSFINSPGKIEGLEDNDIEITNSIISKKDLELLADSLSGKYKKQLDVLGDLHMNARISGNAKLLRIHDLSIRSKNQQVFTLLASGTATNATDPKNISYNFHIKTFTVSKALIAPFVDQTKQKLQLPPVISITGLLEGDRQRLKANLQTVSVFGKASVKGSLVNYENPEKMKYDLVINTNNLETGKWIYKDSLMGKITGTISAKGSNGFEIKKSSLKTTAIIKSFRIEKNEYNNIQLKIDLANGMANYIAAVNDELLQLKVQGDANIKTDYPAVNAVANLQKADLFALGFTKDTMTINMLATIDLKNSSPKNLDAMIRVDSMLVNAGNGKILSDSILLVALAKNDSTIIQLHSSLVDANIASNLDYEQMPDLLKQVMENYITTKSTTGTKASTGAIAVSMFIKPNEQYKALIKDFSFNGVAANVTLSNAVTDSVVKGNITAKEIGIGTSKASNLMAIIQGTADSLHLLAKTDTLRAGNILLFDAMLKAGLTKENISVALNTKDNKKTEQYALAVLATKNKTTDGYDIHLKDELTLNYKKWQVNNNNVIRTSPEGFNVSDFDIYSNQQKISIASVSPGFNDPVKVAIDHFKLSTLTAVYNKDSVMLEGLLNADITASNFSDPIPTMDGTLQLDSIFYQQINVGNINLKATSKNKTVTLDGKLSGNGNDVQMDGNYSTGNIDLQIRLNPLSMSSLQPFTQGNLTRSSGNISGMVAISGTTANPTWNGELNFNKVQTTAAKFGTVLKIDTQKVVLQYPTISFNNFTVRDSTGNPLKINGTLTQSNLTDFTSDLFVTASNFNIINNTAADNNMIYGNAILEVDAMVKGNIYAPDLSGNMLIKNGTDITYIKQNIASSLSERNKVVEFVDMDTIISLVSKKTALEVLEENKNKITTRGILQYNINLEIEPEAKFTILVDPATSDELQVQGKAQINMGVNPDGSLLLTGTYELKDGSYQLNYGPVKRKFNLKEGSTIKLTGDPMNAQASITAVYPISTSPIDLIGNEIGGITPKQNNLYQRKVPFEVLLKIEGSVSKPELSFDIIVKEKAEGVSYELSNTITHKLEQLRNDASAMNKQVFALLTLNRFLASESNDYFGGNGVGNSNLLANESVSGFLNAAVNEIAADLIKGVDIDINLKTVSDDPSSVRTDLNVMLGKSFMNDRLNVSFGKNFTVDGDDPSVKGRSGSNRDIQFIPDVNSTYKLSSDGRYVLRAYRRTQYEAIMDGYFIETGFAFAFTMDYDKFRKLASEKKKK